MAGCGGCGCQLAAVEFLVNYWEAEGHKIIVFSDDLRPVAAYR